MCLFNSGTHCQETDVPQYHEPTQSIKIKERTVTFDSSMKRQQEKSINNKHKLIAHYTMLYILSHFFVTRAHLCENGIRK